MPRKKRPEGTRAPNGASSIYFSEYDQLWHGRVTMGTLDNGEPDRRHVKRKTETEVSDAVQALETARATGKVRKPGRAQTVEAWLTHWFENIAKPSVRYKAANAYRTAVYHWLIPHLGAHRLDKIEPEHFEKLYAKILQQGRKPATAHQVHRTARTAFGEAKNREHIFRNPVELAKAPKVEEEEIEPYDVDEVKILIGRALRRRNGVRYVLALALGPRQGEAIGAKWSRLDRKNKLLRLPKQLQRQTWQHGCDDPKACGARYHKVLPCKETCKRHSRKPCPPPCPANCESHARWCPKRHGGGLVEVPVKSKAGKRGIPLPDQLFALVLDHEKEQAKEREHAGSEWQEGGWMFTQPNGRPIDPRQDLAEWKELLAEAGLRDARLHDARHTAATVLLLLGVPQPVVMELLGWSNSAMARRYQHVTAVIQRGVADQVGGLLWGTD
ncbi:tyrosine-type recombinase/integrase [Crossiella sp. CA198]|uniref:tyrosine-type recombinase/integrase n=1 Tax=Crossiella sp. CA198 TaxID=3455607 RepID=UPI003F8D2BEA